MKIEGIPDGWELVRIGKPFINERYIGLTGQIINCVTIPSGEGYAIVRKIKKQKQYRSFANAAEAEPFWDKKLRMKEWRAKEPGKAMFRINAIGDEDVSIGFQVYSYQSAFDIYECIDGTPFGIEVTE